MARLNSVWVISIPPMAAIAETRVPVRKMSPMPQTAKLRMSKAKRTKVMILATGLRMAVSMAGDPFGRRFGQKFQGFPAGWPARGMISSTPAPGKPQSGCRCFELGDACRAAR